MSETEAEVRWAGWYRPGKTSRWVKLAEALTYDDAWGLLLDRQPEGPGGELLVLPAAKDPNREPAR